MKEGFIKIIGWIYKRSKFKRGSTLIELITAMSINLIIISLSFQIVNISKKNIDFFIQESIIGDYFDDGLMAIDRITKGSMINNIEIVEGNTLESAKIIVTLRKVNLEEKTYDKVISFNNITKRVILETYEGKYRTGVNTIMRNVKEFSINKKENIYYLKIVYEDGRERIQCL
ncbi:prepilin-type cleavage/methylation domain-containing protein [Clostridium sp.]|uniref:prepilin-type cleavage/methylation domain-containing protein n=1 Tax=Clostridium sp. TaxID=1506 RepID=UPI002603AD7D|nr:prepilin-type cleavage/methylation domain-containing protein [Clostridium sp.]